VDRRRFLRGVVAGAPLSVVAGCARPVESAAEDGSSPPKISRKTPTSGLVPSLPVTEVTGVIADGVEAAPRSAEGPDSFGPTLDEHGVTVLKTTAHDSYLSLKQATGPLADGGLARSLGTVAGVYAGVVESAAPGPLSVTLRRDGSKIGGYNVAPEWAEAYLADETTATVYGEKVRDTLKTKS
jgi:hypothetical protein